MKRFCRLKFQFSENVSSTKQLSLYFDWFPNEIDFLINNHMFKNLFWYLSSRSYLDQLYRKSAFEMATNQFTLDQLWPQSHDIIHRGYQEECRTGASQNDNLCRTDGTVRFLAVYTIYIPMDIKKTFRFWAAAPGRTNETIHRWGEQYIIEQRREAAAYIPVHVFVRNKRLSLQAMEIQLFTYVIGYFGNVSKQIQSY